jgi:hypothetical protein
MIPWALRKSTFFSEYLKRIYRQLAFLMIEKIFTKQDLPGFL